MKRQEFIHLFGFGAAMVLTGCLGSCTRKADDPKPAPPQVPGPSGPVDFTLDLNDPANARLNNPAFGYVYGDSRRVIVAKTATGDYIALAAPCTHQGTLVQFQPSNDTFFCIGHGAQFSASGAVLVGPASVALRTYNVVQTGNTLRITG